MTDGNLIAVAVASNQGYTLEPVARAGEIIAYLLKDPAGNTIADYSASRINAAVARMRRLNRGR